MTWKSVPVSFVEDSPVASDLLFWNRRKRLRLRVQWRLNFCVDSRNPVETITRNLSSDGFYCVIGIPYVPGEICDCILHVPAWDPEDNNRTLPVPCRVKIVRVEGLPESGLYGVACQFESYRFADSTAAKPKLVESWP